MTCVMKVQSLQKIVVGRNYVLGTETNIILLLPGDLEKIHSENPEVVSRTDPVIGDTVPIPRSTVCQINIRGDNR